MSPQPTTRGILKAIQIACVAAGITTLAINVALTQQRTQDQRRLSTIKSLLDTELKVDRISPVTYNAIQDHIRPLEYPTLHGHWLLRNISLITSGLLIGCLLADLYDRKVKAASSPSGELSELDLQKEISSKGSSSGSSLNTEN
jgi:hypothetical protein